MVGEDSDDGKPVEAVEPKGFDLRRTDDEPTLLISGSGPIQAPPRIPSGLGIQREVVDAGAGPGEADPNEDATLLIGNPAPPALDPRVMEVVRLGHVEGILPLALPADLSQVGVEPLELAERPAPGPESHPRCARCHRPVPIDDAKCPHCGANALLTIRLDRTPTEREAHRLARAVADLGGALNYSEIRRGLKEAPPRVVSGVTAREADRIEPVLGSMSHPYYRMVDDDAPRFVAPSIIEAPSTPRSFYVAVATVLAVTLFAPLPGSLASLIVSSPTAAAPKKVDPAELPEAPSKEKSARELSEAARNGSARVRCKIQEGAGFFIRPELLVTNAHVVCPLSESPTVVLSNGEEITGSVKAKDEWLDLALITIPKAAPTVLPLGDATTLRNGDDVLAVGSPRGLEFSLAKGIVSYGERVILGIPYIQFDASIHPGNSGGPLIDKDGRVVGVVSMAVRDATGLSLALPINFLFDAPEAIGADLAPSFDRTAWAQLLNRAKEKDEADVNEIKSVGSDPILLRAGGSFGSVMALVGVRSESQPTVKLEFELRRSGAAVCSAIAPAVEWQRAGEASKSSREFTWMEKNSITAGMFIGFATVVFRNCQTKDLADASLMLVNTRAKRNEMPLGPLDH
ncbi:MAG: trypsin-like peptidase domain-containing protein [Deltaproteobacteria bacterium]|nr:trypsin-like peptidase domain-containing protein [Deltaproteobacteria bacterium]